MSVLIVENRHKKQIQHLQTNLLTMWIIYKKTEKLKYEEKRINLTDVLLVQNGSNLAFETGQLVYKKTKSLRQ